MAILDTCTTSTPGESSTRISPEDTIREQINAAIHKRLDELVALQTQRNERAPISRLPPEIIANIFLAVKEGSQLNTMFYYHKRTELLRWTKVSHVCTAWRKIALNFAGLWTEPPLWQEHWAEEMIKRAKYSALTIRIDARTSQRTADLVKKRLLSHKESVRELYFNDDREMRTRWYGFWEGVATGLVRLKRFRVFRGSTNTRTFLPATIFSGANELCYVSLHGCKMDWTLNLPASITTLYLNQVGTVSPLTWPQLITALEALQSLEDLMLIDSLDSFNQIDNLRSHQVMFPRLRRLHVSSSVDEAALLLRHVTFPLTADLDVHANYNRTSPNCLQKVKEMFTAIGKCYMDQPSDLFFPKSMSVYGSFPTEIAINFRNPLKSINDGIRVEIIFQEMDSSGFYDLLYAVFGSGLPIMQDVHSAFIRGFEDLAAPEVAKTFGCLPNLSHIILTDTGLAHCLVPAIGLAVGGEITVGGSTELYFASLTDIQLQGIEFDMECIGNDAFFSALQESLIRRHKCNAQISTLVLNSCSQLNSDMVMRLREIVANVDWDGIEQNFEFTDSGSECNCVKCTIIVV